MPNPALTAALKEAFAVAPTNVIIFNTLEFYHPVAGTQRIVANTSDLTATLENAAEVTFKAVGFRFSLPEVSSNGFQELAITVDNVDRVASDYIMAAKGSKVPIEARYRPYLSTDLSAPQMNPPLVLYVKSATLTTYQVAIVASFADILNKTFLRELYHAKRFPSLT